MIKTATKEKYWIAFSAIEQVESPFIPAPFIITSEISRKLLTVQKKIWNRLTN